MKTTKTNVTVIAGPTIQSLLGEDAKPRKAKAAREPRKAPGRAPKAMKVAGKVSTTPKRESPGRPLEASPLKVPVTFRVIHLPVALWQRTLAASVDRRSSTRGVIHDAIDQDLHALIQELKAVGFGAAQTEKQIRASLDSQIIDTLNKAKQDTGIPALALLRLVLEHHLTRKVDKK